MPLPIAVFWERSDVPGAEHALLEPRDGRYAQGTLLAALPVPIRWVTTGCGSPTRPPAST